LGVIILVSGHCYLTNPASRGDQKTTQTGCRYGNDARRDVDWMEKRTPTCSGPCDKLVGQGYIQPTTIARGTSVTVNWVRHYHSGGFIRFAWAPTPQSDSHAVFDGNVWFYMCKETGGCSADLEPANCGVTFNIPPHLPDGPWTLSWAYFGGEYQAGDYYACIDYIISGGPSGAKPAIVFNGGDAWNTGNQCRFFQTNALHVCTVEPCENGTIPGGPWNGVPAVFLNSGSGNTPTTAAIAQGSGSGGTPTTGAAANTPYTTRSVPYTTRVNNPYTTSMVYTPQVTTSPREPYIPPTGTTAQEGTQWCYKDNTPNIDGPVNTPPTCGNLASNARCLDGQCCSSEGKCGPTPDADGYYYEEVDGSTQLVSQAYAYSVYCTNNQGDYRKQPCSGFRNQWSMILTFLSIAIAVYVF